MTLKLKNKKKEKVINYSVVSRDDILGYRLLFNQRSTFVVEQHCF